MENRWRMSAFERKVELGDANAHYLRMTVGA